MDSASSTEPMPDPYHKWEDLRKQVFEEYFPVGVLSSGAATIACAKCGCVVYLLYVMEHVNSHLRPPEIPTIR